MPFYEYECPHCGFKDEVLQMISEKPLKKCPSCGKAGIKKLVSAPVFRLKGSGWYETDFKSDKENKRNLAGAEKEEPKADSKADAKADSKADPKPDAKADKADSVKPSPVKPAPAKRTAPKSKAKSATRKRR